MASPSVLRTAGSSALRGGSRSVQHQAWSHAAASRPALPGSATSSRLGGRAQAAGSRRTYATATESFKGADRSHLGAGLAGGALVFVLGYAAYRYSGAHQIVSTAHQLSQATDVRHAVKFLRSVAESYAAAIPGGAYLLKHTFDRLEALADQHGPEVTELINNLVAEVKTAIDSGENAGDKILEILSKQSDKLQKLTGAVGSKIMDPLFEQNPKLKSLVGDSLKQLSELASQHGSEARKLLDDTQQQIKDLSAQGFNASTLTEAAHIARTKLREAQEIAQKSGEKVWEQSKSKAGPVLDKLDVRGYLDSAIGPIKSSVGAEGSELIDKTYKELSALAEKGVNKDTIQKAKKLVEERVGKLKDIAQEKGGEASGALSGALGGLSLPGGLDLSKLEKLFNDKAPEAKKLAEDTLSELRGVIEKRADQAGKLGQNVGKEAKDATK